MPFLRNSLILRSISVTYCNAYEIKHRFVTFCFRVWCIYYAGSASTGDKVTPRMQNGIHHADVALSMQDWA